VVKWIERATRDLSPRRRLAREQQQLLLLLLLLLEPPPRITDLEKEQSKGHLKRIKKKS
jgi:hypothetical protein